MGEVVKDVECEFEWQEQEDVFERTWPCRSPLTVVTIHQQLSVTLLITSTH